MQCSHDYVINEHHMLSNDGRGTEILKELGRNHVIILANSDITLVPKWITLAKQSKLLSVTNEFYAPSM